MSFSIVPDAFDAGNIWKKIQKKGTHGLEDNFEKKRECSKYHHMKEMCFCAIEDGENTSKTRDDRLWDRLHIKVLTHPDQSVSQEPSPPNVQVHGSLPRISG